MQNNIQNKMVLVEEDLLKYFQEIKKGKSNKKGKESQKSISQNTEDITSLDVLVINIKQFNMKLKSSEIDSKAFTNLQSLCLNTFTNEDIDYQDILLFINKIIRKPKIFNNLHIKIEDNYNVKTKYNKPDIKVVINQSQAIQICQLLSKAISFPIICQTFNFTIQRNSQHFLYQQNNQTDLENLQKQTYRIQYHDFNVKKPIQEWIKMVNPFINLTHLSLKFGYQFYQSKSFEDFGKAIFSLQQLQCLQLYLIESQQKRKFIKKYIKMGIDQRLINFRESILEKQSKNFIGRYLLQLPNLEKLEISSGYIFANILFFEFNLLEESIFQESKICSLQLAVNQPVSKYIPINANLMFLNKFKRLKRFSFSSDHEEINRLGETLQNLIMLENLDLKITLTEENLFEFGDHFKNLRKMKDLKLYLDKSESNQHRSINNIVKELQYLTELQTLNIYASKYYHLNSEGISFLSYSLKQLQKISSFHLTLVNSKIKDSDLVDLSSAFSQLKTLKKISLSLQKENFFGYEGLSNLGEALMQLDNLEYVYLNLESSNVTKEGTNKLQICLSQIKSKPKIILDIADIETLMLQYFEKNDKKLPPLVLKHIFQYFVIEKQDQPFQTYIHKQETSYLKDISLRDRRDQIMQDPIIIVKEISIAFQQRCIGDIGVQGMANVLRCFTNLSDLSIKVGYNKIGKLGAQHIGNLFQHLPQIKSLQLDLDQNDLETEGINAIYEGLRDLVWLESLSLFMHNYMEDTMSKKGLFGQQFLYKLDLKNNLNIEKIFDPISQIKSLQILILRGYRKVDIKMQQVYFNELSKLNFIKSLQIDVTLEWNQTNDVSKLFITSLRDFHNLNSLKYRFSIIFSIYVQHKTLNQFKVLRRIVTIKQSYLSSLIF